MPSLSDILLAVSSTSLTTTQAWTISLSLTPSSGMIFTLSSLMTISSPEIRGALGP